MRQSTTQILLFSREVTGHMTTTNWLQVQQNSKRLANAFTSFNLNQGDRLATIAWNNHRHLESWYAISGSGYVCHTINPRLFPEQLVFIINDAQDKAIFFDSTFLLLIVAIQGKVPTVEKFICYGARDEKVIAALPDVIFYDDLIQNQSAEFNWRNSAKKRQVLYVIPQAQQAIRKAYCIATVLLSYTLWRLACQTH
jgi:fatty-acyl-CoA synthase